MKKRVISALVALAIIIPIVIIGGIPYAIVIGLLSVLAYKEFIDLKKSHKEFPIIVVILGLVSLIYLVLGNYMLDGLGYISTPKLMVPIILLLLPTVFYKKDKYNTNNAFYLIGVVYLLGLLFNSLINIRSISIYLLIYLLCVDFLTDTFAYIIGNLIGKHKMCPKISPNKTWEGAIAGLIGGVTISVIVFTNLLGDFSINVVIMTIILSVIGQVGDLLFSKIKRENDIKDFSNLIPGHGGILDRIDSLSFVVLAYIVLRVIL